MTKFLKSKIEEKDKKHSAEKERRKMQNEVAAALNETLVHHWCLKRRDLL